MTDRALEAAFWAVVIESLQRFHGYSFDAARASAADLRDSVERPDFGGGKVPGYVADTIYHAEPFFIACDIAGRALPIEEYAAAYEAIAARQYASCERTWRDARSAAPAIRR